LVRLLHGLSRDPRRLPAQPLKRVAELFYCVSHKHDRDGLVEGTGTDLSSVPEDRPTEPDETGGSPPDTTRPVLAVSGLTGNEHCAEPPQIVAHGLERDTLAARAVTYRGSGHVLTGEPRQDAFALSANAQWLFAVVSDGIGSCEYSQHGAATAVHAVAAALALADADPADGESLMKLASGACRDAAEALGVEPHLVSATLTIAAVEVAAQLDGGRHVLMHSAGDSPILLLQPADRAWTYLTPREDFAANVVRSWIPDHYHDGLQAGCTLSAGDILVLCSDGFSIPLGDGNGPLGEDLVSRWAPGPRGVLAFLADLSFDAYHDDKTVVAIWNGRPS
jgi:serine/threonine protein phosphatase PrpC